MNCERFEALLMDYLEGTLTKEDSAAMDQHISECADCRQSLEDMRLLLQDLTSMDSTAQVPADWKASWREAVYREEKEQMQQTEVRRKTPWRTWVSAAAAIIVLVSGSIAARDWVPGTESPENNTNQAMKMSAQSPVAYDTGEYENQSADMYMATMPEAGGGMERSSLMADTALSKTASSEPASTQNNQGVKIIRTASYSLNTMRFDQDLEGLKALAASFNGWVEYVDVTGDTTLGETRYANLTLRIPTESLDSFKSGVGSYGRVVGSNESASDVSESYADTQMRLQTQKDKMERLRNLMTTTGELADLLAVENEIANTQYQIDSYESSLRGTDSRVNFTSVQVFLKEETAGEAASAKELTLTERIAKGFAAAIKAIGSFAQDLVVFLAMALPVLIPIAIALFIIVKVRKHHKNAKQTKQQ